MDTKLIYPVNLPKHLIDKCNIDEDTVFIARYDDGQILLESLTDHEREEWYDADFEDELDDSYEEGFFEGRLFGFKDGYEQGYHDSSDGNKYDPDFDRFEEAHRNTDDSQHSADLDEVPSNASTKPQCEISLRDFLDGLSTAEKRAALVYLSVKYTEEQRGAEDAD